jgi:hypothetical protein
MSFPYELIPQPTGDEPEIRMQLGGQEFLLRRENTIVKQFSVGDGMFDHALHAPDEVSVLPIFFDQPGGKQLKSQLIAAEYYSFSLGKLDQETIDLVERHIRATETWLD